MDTTTILISLIIFLGGFTQALTGFGLTLICVPLLSMTIDAKVALPIAGIFGWLVSLPVVWKMRHHIQFRSGLTLVLGSIPASFIGVQLLANMSSSLILIFMGIVLMISSIYVMRAKQPLFKTTSPSITIGAGFTSGILGSSVGQSGPPVIAYTSMQPWTDDQAKSTLAFFFMLQMISAVMSFYHEGLITEEVQYYIVLSFPAFALSMIGGMVGYHQLKRYKVKYHHIVHSFLFMIGCLLVVNNINWSLL